HMMQTIAPLLPAAKQPAYRRLLQARELQQRQCEQQSLQALARQLVATAKLQESLDPAQGKLLARAWQSVSGKVAATLGAKGAVQDADLPSDPRAQAAIRQLLQSVQQADVQSTQRLL